MLNYNAPYLMKVITVNEHNIVETAKNTLDAGGIVVYPTETCYGIGVDATNQNAVNALLSYKSRREGKPISIAVSDPEMAAEYAEINTSASNLYENFLPGPLTVISNSTGKVAEGIESEYGTIGIRIPDYPLVIDIITKLGRPITATSANVSYKRRPYSIKTFTADLPKKHAALIDLFIDAGDLPPNDVSTIVDTTLNDMNIMREGQIAFRRSGNALLEAKTSGPAETSKFGAMVTLKYIDEIRKGPLILALGGELGSGKTQFTKGVATQLGIKHTIKSPTYTISQEYPFTRADIDGQLIHMDTWRISSAKELDTLRLDRFLKKGNVIVIEWADKFFDTLPNLLGSEPHKLLKVKFEHLDKNTRSISVE